MLLVAVAVPMMMKSAARTRQAQCVGNLKEITRAVLERCCDKCAMDLLQRLREFGAVASAPRRASCKSYQFSIGKRNALAYRAAVIGLLLDDGKGNLVSTVGKPLSPTANPARTIQLGLRLMF